MRPSTMVARFLVVLAMTAAGLVVAGATSAHAAPTCGGTTCSGKDPQNSGCSPGATNVSGTEYWGDTYSRALRNSGACTARWTRLVIDDPEVCCVAIGIAVESQRYYAGNWIAGEWQYKRVLASQTGNFWTPMIANRADDRARACHRFEAPDGSSASPWTCSGWVS